MNSQNGESTAGPNPPADSQSFTSSVPSQTPGDYRTRRAQRRAERWARAGERLRLVALVRARLKLRDGLQIRARPGEVQADRALDISDKMAA